MNVASTYNLKLKSESKNKKTKKTVFQPYLPAKINKLPSKTNVHKVPEWINDAICKYVEFKKPNLSPTVDLNTFPFEFNLT